MTINYYIKTAYGRRNMYIVDKTVAEAVQSLTGRKVIIQEHKEALEKLGFTFLEIPQPPAGR